MFSDHSGHSARRAITDPLVCSVRSFFYLLRAPSETDGTVNVAAELPGNECGCCRQHVCPVPTDESAAKNTSQGSSLGSRPLWWEAHPTRDYEVCMWREVSQSLSGGCLEKKKEIKSTVSGKIRIPQASSTVLDTQQLHHTSFRPHPQPGAGSAPDHRPVFVTCGRLQQSLGFSSKLKSGCRQTAKHVFWRIS